MASELLLLARTNTRSGPLFSLIVHLGMVGSLETGRAVSAQIQLAEWACSALVFVFVAALGVSCTAKENFLPSCKMATLAANARWRKRCAPNELCWSKQMVCPRGARWLVSAVLKRN